MSYELQILKRKRPIGNDVVIGLGWIHPTDNILQYRTYGEMISHPAKTEMYYGPKRFEWSDWKDVQIVEENTEQT